SHKRVLRYHSILHRPADHLFLAHTPHELAPTGSLGVIDRALFPHKFTAKRQLPALAHEDVLPVCLFLDALAILEQISLRAHSKAVFRPRYDVGNKDADPDEA